MDNDRFTVVTIHEFVRTIPVLHLNELVEVGENIM